MKKKLTTAVSAENTTPYKVYGMVHDAHQQVRAKTTVRVYERTLRGLKLLGEILTKDNGGYLINYQAKNLKHSSLIIRLYDKKNSLLKENEVYSDVPEALEIDFDLSGQSFSGAAEYEQLIDIIAPFTAELPLAQMTQTEAHPDLSFIAQKTGIEQQIIEKIAMAARFEHFSGIPAMIWFGLLGQTNNLTGDFETRLTAIFDNLMHTSTATLLENLQNAIKENVLPHRLNADLAKLEQQFQAQLSAYAAAHPVTNAASVLHQTAELAGLKGKELSAFVAARTNHNGSEADFWQQGAGLQKNKNAENLQTVFQVSKLTGDNLSLTSNLVNEYKVASASAIRKLAEHTHKDWSALLKKHKIEIADHITGRTRAEKIESYAAQLDTTFATAFPTTAFAARLQKDTKSKLKHRDKIHAFLKKNEHFDLLNHNIGTFIKENKNSVAKKDEEKVTHQVRRIQRVFKLAPTYESANVLLEDDIHSAQQVYKMGKDNFVNTYADKLGTEKAEQIFENASTVHANVVALTGDLRSLSNASAINAFPNFNTAIAQQLTHDLPNLDTLFGRITYCDCQECNSVYGAPAYLTDLLHYLDKRNSQLPAAGSPLKKPSVKDLLFKRRPDLGDIDLNCENTNIEIPYIDIACEVMEDYISPPAVSLTSASYVAVPVKGVISAPILTALKTQFTAIGQTNIGSLLSPAATVSDPYTANHLQADNVYAGQQNWIIRDARIVLKASQPLGQPGANIEFRVLRQTLSPGESISTGAEYLNANVYSNFLKTVKAPFTLPFDLFETEGELYLEKLGVKKAGLIDIFRKEDKLAPGASPADLKVGYASLGINEAEQTLIFVADIANQANYWGAANIGTSIPVNVFEKLTGLDYDQILSFLQLQFINPAKDIVIEHDELLSNTSTQRLINLTTAKLDVMHRFIRLWRKTGLTMTELDAVIMAPAIGQGKIAAKLALQLSQFASLQQKLKLSAFELLAFYQHIDTTRNLPACLFNQLFQNGAITNPVSANFSIEAVTPGTQGIAEADRAVIAAVLQISVNEVNVLIAKSVNRISMPVLSTMYRYALFAKSLDIQLNELFTLMNLVDANPFQDVQATTLFLQKYQLLKSSGLSIAELNYILRHQDDLDQGLLPAKDQVSGAIEQLQNELLSAGVIAQPKPDANGVLLSKWLSESAFRWDADVLRKLTDILNTVDNADYQQKIEDNSNFMLNLRLVYNDAVLSTNLSVLPMIGTPGVPIVFPASLNGQISFDADKKLLKLKGYLSQTDKAAVLALANDDESAYHNAVINLFDRVQPTDSSAANTFFADKAALVNNLKAIPGVRTEDRFAYFVDKLAPVYKKQKQQDVLIKNISNWFSVDKTIASQLIALVPAIYNEFTEDHFVNKIPAQIAERLADAYPVQANRYQFVAKTCFVVNKLKLTTADLAFLYVQATAINTLNFAALPLAPVATAATTFASFENLINLLRFQVYYPAKLVDTTSLSIYTILNEAIGKGTLAGPVLAAYIAGLIANLNLLTGWGAAGLTAMISSPNYSTLTLPADLKSVPILMRLHQRFALLQQLGVTAVDAYTWTKDSLLAADSAKIKRVLKQSYTESDWQDVSMPLQRVLREKKRDALVAYLLANPGTQTWKNEKDLYGYFLLDVGMGALQNTSRIVMATNSVQLFVQRCFVGLEDSIIVDAKLDSNWLQWKWMKNFRVWQANIKVFLYPENYIEPELLPKGLKSPFLDELEGDLLQGEVTASSAETAFHNYLQKINNTARLEIKGMWYDDLSNTLHVFGRTYGGDPKVYYYRKFIEGRRWTPWEEVNLDITGEFIMPVVYNNHVYLFWAIVKPQASNVANWQIQLAYSEYQNGKWSAKKISENNDAGLIICPKASNPDLSRFFFLTIDIPTFNYDSIINIFNASIPSAQLIDYLKTVKEAVIQNGSLALSCFYRDPVLNGFAGLGRYISSFQLDITKGYPVKINLSPFFGFGSSDRLFRPLDTDFVGHRNMINMLQAETTFPFSPVIPQQVRGNFTRLIPLQMGFQERAAYILNMLGPIDLPAAYAYTGFMLPGFYQDKNRTYLLVPEFTNDTNFSYKYEDQVKLTMAYLNNDQSYFVAESTKLKALNVSMKNRFHNFFQPLIGHLMQNLFVGGIDGLMSRDTQLKGDAVYDTSPKKFNFVSYFTPLFSSGRGQAVADYPIDDLDFDLKSGYGLYNWEIFFHAPLMIAERLSQNQQFEEADRWYKYIFNPMDTSDRAAPNKFWNTKPFFKHTNQDYITDRIDKILIGANNATDPELLNDVNEWRNNPFQPHLIAGYRTVAYQKTTVMKYVGHLIRHADYLFNQNTRESVNEATQLYILAEEILGPKPEILPSVTKTLTNNYRQLEVKLDVMSDALVSVENLLPLHIIKGYTGTQPSVGLPNLNTMYFCMPMNENMAGPTGYWDTISDRLFKIRHSMNIDGSLAPLSLFSPVIDPAILVRATAAGLDIGSILADVNAPLPSYRFMVIVQKAAELVNEVKSLGGLLLSVLEKKDAEALSQLRSGQEVKILSATLSLKQRQIEESQVIVDGLLKQKEMINIRQKYYSGLVNKGLSVAELSSLSLNYASTGLNAAIAISYLLGSGVAAAPDISAGALAGATGGAIALTSDGGSHAADSANSMARNLATVANALDKTASIISTQAGYNRRNDEWQYQLDLANKELEQIDKQIAAAGIRLDINAKDVTNHQLMVDQASETRDFMYSKFTNKDLFNWMVTQTSNTYFKSYQLAYDIAKRAEHCFRYELGVSSSSYINFGYWDSLKKGLLAGEQLSYDLKNMEMAYYEQNKRELELTKPISLSQLDPVALLKLKTTGECWVNFPEELFDMDYPGHYMRRVKSVSITIPCITGPYTTVNCKLTMTNNSVRTSALAAADAAQYPRKLANGIPTDDPRFRDAVGALQSIATSHAQNDSGLFELNFRDERYLPFEGAGAISLWHIELPAAVKQFDYDTISDVIINLKYTARDGGDVLKNNAVASLNSKINQMLVSTKDRGLMRIFSAKNDLSTEWFRFLHPVNATDHQVLLLNLDKSRFPLFAQSKTIRIKSIELIADSSSTAINGITVTPAPSAPIPINLTAKGIYGNHLSVSLVYNTTPGTWQIVNPATNPRLTPDTICNMVIIVHYEVA